MTTITPARDNATRRASSFLAEHDVATFNLAKTPPPVAVVDAGKLVSYSRALEFTSMALSSGETNTTKMMSRRFSADAVARPSIDEDKSEDPLGRHVADHVIFIPKRRPSTPGITSSKPSEQHATKNGDISSDTTADDTGSTRKGLYNGGVRYFTVDDARTRKDEVLKAKESNFKERCDREVKQEEEKKKKSTLSSSCTDVTVIKEKRSKSLSRSTPDINRGRSVSRTSSRQIDILQSPFEDRSLNDKKNKMIASSTLKGHSERSLSREGRQEEKTTSSPLSTKLKRSKSRSRSVTRTRQVDGILVPYLPFKDDENIASIPQEPGRHASFHGRLQDRDAILKTSFRDSVGASCSRLRRSESNDSPPPPFLLNSERRIRMMKEKSVSDDRITKIRDIEERGRESSRSATRKVVTPPPPRTMFENKTSSPISGGRNQSYQRRSLFAMEFGAVPSRRSSSSDRGSNRISRNIPPCRDVLSNHIDFGRHSTKDLKLDSAEEKEKMKKYCAHFVDKKNETRPNSMLRSFDDVLHVVDKKKAENISRRNSILSSSSEHNTCLSSVQGRDRNSRSQSRDRSSTIKYKAPPTLPIRSLFQNKPMFGSWGGSGGVKVKEDWRNVRPLPSELRLLSRSKSSTDNSRSSTADMSNSPAENMNISTRSSIVFPQRVARSCIIHRRAFDSRRSSM